MRRRSDNIQTIPLLELLLDPPAAFQSDFQVIRQLFFGRITGRVEQLDEAGNHAPDGFKDLIWVPRSYEHLFTALPTSTDWSIASEENDINQTVDESRLLPQFVYDANERSNILKADPNLTLRIFDAYPAIPANSSNTGENENNFHPRTPAATRFRLAPIYIKENLNEEQNYTGKLAPAYSGTDKPKQELIVTQQDETPFQVYEAFEGSDPYPRPRRGPWIGSQAARDDGDSLGGILPPLIDIVSWAARPGEMMRSRWLAKRQEIGLDDGLTESWRHPIGVSLRRPRAAAGSDDSVILEFLPPNPQQKQSPTFAEAAFNLRQILKESAIPTSTESPTIALTTKNAVYFGNEGAADEAKLVYEILEGKNEQFILLEDFGLYVLYEKRPDSGNLLIWSNIIDGDSHDLLDLGDVTWPDDSVVRLSKDKLDSLKYAIKDIIDKKEENELYLSIQPIGANRSPDTLKIKFIEKSSQLIPPPMVVALLATETNPDGETMLAGYGRLAADQFSTVEPHVVNPGSDPQKKKIRWERTALVKTLHRKKTADTTYKYDVILYGAGGELLKTSMAEE